MHELRCIDQQPAIILLAQRPHPTFHEQALRMGAQDIISRQRLGREALGARVRNAVRRNQYRLAHERFVRDLQIREASREEGHQRDAIALLAPGQCCADGGHATAPPSAAPLPDNPCPRARRD